MCNLVLQTLIAVFKEDQEEEPKHNRPKKLDFIPARSLTESIRRKRCRREFLLVLLLVSRSAGAREGKQSLTRAEKGRVG